MVCWWRSSSLRFILGRGVFRNDINDKCILCKNSDNSQEHVVNECAKTKKLRTKLIKELNDLDNATKNKTLLDSIFYWYYSKDLQAKKSDNKGIRLIKKYVFKIYKLMKEISSRTSKKNKQIKLFLFLISNMSPRWEKLTKIKHFFLNLLMFMKIYEMQVLLHLV